MRKRRIIKYRIEKKNVYNLHSKIFLKGLVMVLKKCLALRSIGTNFRFVDGIVRLDLDDR